VVSRDDDHFNIYLKYEEQPREHERISRERVTKKRTAGAHVK